MKCRFHLSICQFVSEGSGALVTAVHTLLAVWGPAPPCCTRRGNSIKVRYEIILTHKILSCFQSTNKFSSSRLGGEPYSFCFLENHQSNDKQPIARIFSTPFTFQSLCVEIIYLFLLLSRGLVGCSRATQNVAGKVSDHLQY